MTLHEQKTTFTLNHPAFGKISPENSKEADFT